MGCLRWVLLAAAGAASLAAQVEVPAREWNERGVAASARGEFAEAETLLRESVRLWRDMGPRFEEHLAISMVNLAEAECGQGHWADGAKLLADALEISRRAFGPADIHTLTNLNYLASADMILGEYDAAGALFGEALQGERKLYPDSIQLADTLMGMSSLQMRTGHPDQALAPAEQALQVALHTSGENMMQAAVAYANVAQIHLFTHRADRAIPLFRKAETIYAKLYSTEDPRYAGVLSQEGLALMEDGKLSLAARDMEKAVEILSRSKGREYLEAMARSNLGWLRYRQGKYSDADTMLSKAVALQESYSAHPSSEMAMTLDRLAEVRKKEHRYDDADQLHKRAATLSTYR